MDIMTDVMIVQIFKELNLINGEFSTVFNGLFNNK